MIRNVVLAYVIAAAVFVPVWAYVMRHARAEKRAMEQRQFERQLRCRRLANPGGLVDRIFPELEQ